MDELLLKFLDRQATRSEEIIVKSWIESSEDNLQYFQYFTNSWNECWAYGYSLLFNSISVIQ